MTNYCMDTYPTPESTRRRMKYGQMDPLGCMKNMTEKGTPTRTTWLSTRNGYQDTREDRSDGVYTNDQAQMKALTFRPKTSDAWPSTGERKNRNPQPTAEKMLQVRHY